jgi:3-oxoacyl-[acyl-carrier-protein] synthase-3
VKKPLSVLGVGLHLPPSHDVLELARSKGAETSSEYRGWKRVVLARDDEQPSTMGAAALEQALARSGVSPEDLKFVMFTGLSRDYLPSWSVSVEIMRLCGIPGSCFGLDVTAGCVATLSALDLLQGWLQMQGGGHAAVVASERWSHTVDYSDASLSGLWSYGDSAAALVVGLDVPQAPLCEFLGAEFRTTPDFNGQVIIRYGGTREPQAPPGVNPHLRALGARVKKDVTAAYRRGYSDAYEALRARFGVQPEWLICNQSTPQVVLMLAELFGLQGRVTTTGDRTGHLGGVDVLVALDELTEKRPLDKPVLVGSSTSYGFGTGLLTPTAGQGARRRI